MTAHGLHSTVQFQRKDALPKSYCFALFYACFNPFFSERPSPTTVSAPIEDNSRLGSSGAITEISSQPNISYPYFMDSSTCGASHHRPNRRKVNGGNFGHGIIPGHNSLFRNKRISLDY